MICATAAGSAGCWCCSASPPATSCRSAALALGLLSSYTASSSNTVLQTRSDAACAWNSLHGLTMMGVVPLGVMLEGALGSVLGVQFVAALGGALTVVAALAVFIFVPRLRRSTSGSLGIDGAMDRGRASRPTRL